MTDKIIDCIDKNGNDFLDNIIKPIAKGTLQYTVNDTKVVQYFLTMKTAFMENKISQFLKYIEEEQDNSILDFINNLNENEKVFFIETVNKIIDMDDLLQMYILSQLTDSFKNNGKLNYWEKSLYYNIDKISEDDFLLFFDFIDTLEEPIKSKVIYGLSKDTKDENVIMIKKLESIGILGIEAGGFAEECINLSPKHDYSVAFQFYPYVNELYIMIKNFKEYETN